MKKIQIYLIIIFTQFLFLEQVNSAEIDIYKKIDLFGEVLEKNK
jgi:carboxyl-terminal processing protease